MTRTYAKLFVSVWDADGDFRTLTGGAQRLYFLLMSHPQLSSAGVLPLQPRKWATRAADTTPRQIERALDELTSRRFVIVDTDTEEALVRAYIRRDGGTRTPNILKAIQRAIGNIESEPLREQAEKELAKALAEAMRNPSGNPSRNGHGKGSDDGS